MRCLTRAIERFTDSGSRSRSRSRSRYRTVMLIVALQDELARRDVGSLQIYQGLGLELFGGESNVVFGYVTRVGWVARAYRGPECVAETVAPVDLLGWLLTEARRFRVEVRQAIERRNER